MWEATLWVPAAERACTMWCSLRCPPSSSVLIFLADGTPQPPLDVVNIRTELRSIVSISRLGGWFGGVQSHQPGAWPRPLLSLLGRSVVLHHLCIAQSHPRLISAFSGRTVMVAATHGLAAPPFSALTLNTAFLRLGTSTSDLHHYAPVVPFRASDY